MANYLLILKALHIIAAIAWMAGLFYLPRLFAYHADAETGSVQSETFKIMERRLLRAIMNPAMIATLVFGGLTMGAMGATVSDGWLWVKLAAVGGLLILHMSSAVWRKAFEADANKHSARYYKIVNEVPALLMIVIILMAVLRPF